jgi:hypothetical protein
MKVYNAAGSTECDGPETDQLAKTSHTALEKLTDSTNTVLFSLSQKNQSA